MAAPTLVEFTMRGANPNIGFLSDAPTTVGTGARSTIYFPPVGASKINIVFSVPSTGVATVEGSCDNPETLKADTANGTWVPINAALTGVTGGAVVLSEIPPGIVGVRVNQTTAVAALTSTVKMSTSNPNTY